MTDLALCEWQMVGQDDWIFGEKIRGIVRTQLALVYYNEEPRNPEGGWIWRLLGEPCNAAMATGRPYRGASPSLSAAIWQAEQALGIA